MATPRDDVPSDYDLIVDIESFEQLTNGNPGWEVRCPEIERQMSKLNLVDGTVNGYFNGSEEDTSAPTEANATEVKQSENVAPNTSTSRSVRHRQQINTKTAECKIESPNKISGINGEVEEADRVLTGVAVVADSLHRELETWKLKSEDHLSWLSVGPTRESNVDHLDDGLTSNLDCDLVKPLNNVNSDCSESKEEAQSSTLVGEPLHLQYDSKRGATIFVAVVGLYNKGKTYVLNHIGKTNLPEGAGYRTTGISMKTGNGDILSRFTLLDIAGFDAPVRVGQDRSAVYYKKYVDRFIEQLALNLATAVVVVMNNITLTDQLYLEHVRKAMHGFKRDYAAANGISARIPEEKFPDIIVIHNFSSYGNLEECKKAFRRQIEQNYEGKWLDYDRNQRFYYTEGVPGQMVGIRHVFIGRSLTEAERSRTKESVTEPDFYQATIRHNIQVFEMIKAWLKGIANQSKVEPVSTMVDVANSMLKSYFQNPPTVRLHVKNSKAYIGFEQPWNYDFTQPGKTAKPEVIMPGIMMLPGVGFDGSRGLRMSVQQAHQPPYDVISTPSSVAIIMDRMIPQPKVEYIPQQKTCVIKGDLQPPPLYTKEGSVVECRQRFGGEFTLQVVMDDILTHGDAVALSFRDVIEDKTKNILCVLFDKVQIQSPNEVKEGCLDEIL